jgi:hypothetical protein
MKVYYQQLFSYFRLWLSVTRKYTNCRCYNPITERQTPSRLIRATSGRLLYKWRSPSCPGRNYLFVVRECSGSAQLRFFECVELCWKLITETECRIGATNCYSNVTLHVFWRACFGGKEPWFSISRPLVLRRCQIKIAFMVLWLVNDE